MMEYINNHPAHSHHPRSQSARVGIHGCPDRETDEAVAVSVG